MSWTLVDAPPSLLSLIERRFVDALRVQLDEQGFNRLATDGIAVEKNDALKLTLRHPDDESCSLWTSVRDDWITIFLGDAHEDFHPSFDGEEGDGANFVDEAVAWFTDALCGRIELKATYRGSDLLSARYVRHSLRGGTQGGGAAFLTPAQLRIWEPTHVVRRRPSWR